MRAYQFLIEYSQGPLLRTFGSGLVTRWKKEGKPFSDEMGVDEEGNATPESILHWIEQQDPTDNNKYTTWMVHRYASKNANTKLEDLQTQAKEDLTKFHNLSRKQNFPQEYKNIDVFKSLPDLSKFLRQYNQDKSDEQSQTELTNLEKGELLLKQGKDVELLLDTPEYRVIIPKTFEMSKFFGSTIANSSWCITKSENMWNYYNLNSGDVAYFIIHKSSNSWWSWVIKSREYVDINNDHIGDVDDDSYETSFAGMPDDLGPIDLTDFINQHRPAVNAIIKYNGGLANIAKLDALTWIRHLKNPSEEIKLAAVTEDGFALQLIENPSEAVQLMAVNGDGEVIKYIDNPSEAVQLAAVKSNGKALEHIVEKGIKPTEEMNLAAVFEYPYSIDYIENPSEAVQLTAVKRDGHVIGRIENPSEAVKQTAEENKKGFPLRPKKDFSLERK